MANKFIVLTNTIFNGWVNCWTDGDEKPLSFPSREEAQREIDNAVWDMGYEPEAYRIEEVK